MSKKETKESMPTTVGPGQPEGPQFPWGLQVTLGDESLRKMDITLSDYKIGDIAELYAKVKVTEISQTARAGEKNPQRRMELQIIAMDLEPSDDTVEEEKRDDDEIGWEEDNQQETDRKLKKRGF